MKVFFILQIVFAAAFFQLTSCGYTETQMAKIPVSSDKAELFFFYKKSASNDERQSFEKNVLHKARPDGRGDDLAEGVSGIFIVRNSNYEGYSVEFYPNATLEMRANLKKAIESSPVIYKVFENVVPNQTQDL